MRRHCHALAAALLALAACFPAAAGSTAGAEPLKWTFDTDLDGWTKGVAGVKDKDDNWGTVHQLPRNGGIVQLDGSGAPGQPNAWISKSIALPENAKTLSFDVSAHDRADADSHFTVFLVDSASTNALFDEIVTGVEGSFTFKTQTADISRWAGKIVTLFFEQDDNGVNGEFPGGDEQILLDNIRIVTGCDLQGTVFDGEASDGHHNPLAGVAVVLEKNLGPTAFQDPFQPEGTPPAVTGADGRYCLVMPDITQGDYRLRVDLADAEHNPPIFSVHTSLGQSATRAVTADDVGPQDFDLTFSSPDGPGLSDGANIYWQSSRFVRWLVDTLQLDPASLAGLVIDTDASGGTRYDPPPTKTVFIDSSDTPYSERADAATNCPENCEWHEISHHVANILGIAPTRTAAACNGRVNHGGWTNDSTCDSLSEGFAIFLATLGSLDIDSGKGPGYATPDYADFASLEDNGYRPWSSDLGFYREDIAVAQLLWDLADDTPPETANLFLRAGGGVLPATAFRARDRVGLGGTNLVGLLASGQPSTVADIYDDLLADPAVPTSLKIADLDLDGNGTPDVSPLAEVFLDHGFHPTLLATAGASLADDEYIVGDPIALTQPGANGLSVRRSEKTIPGSGIRLQNASSAPVTFSIDVTYPSTTSHLEVAVMAHADRVVHLELPAYWRGLPPTGGGLPACGNPDPYPVSVEISSPGIQSRTVSSCEYLKAVAATTTDSALAYSVGVDAPTSSAAPTSAGSGGGLPIGGVLGLVAAVLAMLGIAALAIRVGRRRAG